MRVKLPSVVLGLLTLFALFGAASGQTIRREASLLEKPSGSPRGGVLPSGTPVKILERQGFWLRVEVNGRSGWIKASGITFSEGSGGPTAIDTGRLGTNNIVSTSAARGLSAKDLLNGTPRMDEVGKMAQYVADASALQSFVSQGRIVTSSKDIVLKARRPVTNRIKPIESDSIHTTTPPTLPAKAKKGGDDW